VQGRLKEEKDMQQATRGHQDNRRSTLISPITSKSFEEME
jgi:hypothetical protein